jgi:hypothetical protein
MPQLDLETGCIGRLTAEPQCTPSKRGENFEEVVRKILCAFAQRALRLCGYS